MQFVKSKLKCQECIKPAARRMSLFQANDSYECYAESYVKCFWGLCDHHKSMDSLTTTTSDGKVITTQPVSDCPLKNRAVIKELLLSQ